MKKKRVKTVPRILLTMALTGAILAVLVFSFVLALHMTNSDWNDCPKIGPFDFFEKCECDPKSCKPDTWRPDEPT